MTINSSLIKTFRFGSSFLGSALVLTSFAQVSFAEEINAHESQPVIHLTEPTSQPISVGTTIDSSETISQISTYANEGNAGSQGIKKNAQVTSVSQLSDVQPTDWAFQALQSLVERYGCIAGYPNRTYRGNRPLTRYEFAAGLNACMDRVNELIASATADLVKKEDLAALKKLQEEFAAELGTLRGRVDSLESRTKTLEAQQFSTTTKLSGQVIFSLVQLGGNVAFPGNAPGTNRSIANQTTFNSRATLNLLTSFTGKDLLITSLQGGNYQALNAAGTPLALNLGPSVTTAAANNNVAIYYLGYRVPLFKEKGTLFVTAAGGELSDFTDSLNPYFEDEGQGALSAFGLRNPIYRQVNSLNSVNFAGVGGGFRYQFNQQVDLGVGYLAPGFNASNPGSNVGINGGGLFGGDFAAIAQLTVKPIKTLGLGLAYVRSYAKSPSASLAFGGLSGTNDANAPFSSIVPTSANSVSFQFNWKALPKFALGGWVGATFAEAQSSFLPFGVRSGDNATILNYALTFAFPDLFKKGNLGGVVLGSQPQVISSNSPFSRNINPDTNIHVEAFYRFKINDFISVTPGGFVVLNPEGNSNNDPIYATTVRTTFSF